MRKIALQDEAIIIQAYRDGVNSPELGRRYGVTRQTILSLLKRNRVRVIERKLSRRCSHCGATVRRFRGRMQSRKVYCGRACYHAQLSTSGYQAHRQSSRKARAIVAQYFPLEERQVVHHRDKDQRNNELSNLMVFASQADHMRWHRAGAELSGVIPLWEGWIPTGSRAEVIKDHLRRRKGLS